MRGTRWSCCLVLLFVLSGCTMRSGLEFEAVPMSFSLGDVSHESK